MLSSWSLDRSRQTPFAVLESADNVGPIINGLLSSSGMTEDRANSGMASGRSAS